MGINTASVTTVCMVFSNTLTTLAARNAVARFKRSHGARSLMDLHGLSRTLSSEFMDVIEIFKYLLLYNIHDIIYGNPADKFSVFIHNRQCNYVVFLEYPCHLLLVCIR